MTFLNLLAKIKAFPIKEKRFEQPNFLEVVILTKDLEAFSRLLENYFGPPVKPLGEIPAGRWSLLAEEVGGVRQNQTLYGQEEESAIYLAMIWPWGDKTLATVKVIQRKPKIK